MPTDKGEHEAGDKILLAGCVSRTVEEWRGVLPLPAAASCDLAHAHLHSITLQLDSIAGCLKLLLLHHQLQPRHAWLCIYDINKEVIAWKEKGEKNIAIGIDLGLSESSIRTIWRKSE